MKVVLFKPENYYLYSKSHAEGLNLQAAFLKLQNISEKLSQTVHYNWKLNDQLLTFCVKARLIYYQLILHYILG